MPGDTPTDRASVEGVLHRLEGPHEWGYRDPVEGGFVCNDHPFDAASTLRAMLAEREADKAEIERLREVLDRQIVGRGEAVDRWRRATAPRLVPPTTSDGDAG